MRISVLKFTLLCWFLADSFPFECSVPLQQSDVIRDWTVAQRRRDKGSCQSRLVAADQRGEHHLATTGYTTRKYQRTARSVCQCSHEQQSVMKCFFLLNTKPNTAVSMLSTQEHKYEKRRQQELHCLLSSITFTNIYFLFNILLL